MLLTETNTLAVKNAVCKAACKVLGIPKRDIQADFEHGQWWITRISTGAQWSACDSEPGPFFFEQVTEGEEL